MKHFTSCSPRTFFKFRTSRTRSFLSRFWLLSWKVKFFDLFSVLLFGFSSSLFVVTIFCSPFDVCSSVMSFSCYCFRPRGICSYINYLDIGLVCSLFLFSGFTSSLYFLQGSNDD